MKQNGGKRWKNVCVKLAGDNSPIGLKFGYYLDLIVTIYDALSIFCDTLYIPSNRASKLVSFFHETLAGDLRKINFLKNIFYDLFSIYFDYFKSEKILKIGSMVTKLWSFEIWASGNAGWKLILRSTSWDFGRRIFEKYFFG